MSNQQRLIETFVSALQIDAAMVTDGLKYDSIVQWDSIGHMTLVAALETQFDIMLDTDDIIDMSSVAKAKEILSRHGVGFQ